MVFINIQTCFWFLRRNLEQTYTTGELKQSGDCVLSGWKTKNQNKPNK